MIQDMSSGNIYLNVVARVNQDYADLIDHLKEMDTRMAYLKTFELSLSVALPRPLWESEKYIAQARITPMPDDPYTLLDFETFRGWMTVYEFVMRDEGLIGTRQQAVIGLEDLPERTKEVSHDQRQRVHARPPATG